MFSYTESFSYKHLLNPSFSMFLYVFTLIFVIFIFLLNILIFTLIPNNITLCYKFRIIILGLYIY